MTTPDELNKLADELEEGRLFYSRDVGDRETAVGDLREEAKRQIIAALRAQAAQPSAIAAARLEGAKAAARRMKAEAIDITRNDEGGMTLAGRAIDDLNPDTIAQAAVADMEEKDG